MNKYAHIYINTLQEKMAAEPDDVEFGGGGPDLSRMFQNGVSAITRGVTGAGDAISDYASRNWAAAKGQSYEPDVQAGVTQERQRAVDSYAKGQAAKKEREAAAPAAPITPFTTPMANGAAPAAPGIGAPANPPLGGNQDAPFKMSLGGDSPTIPTGPSQPSAPSVPQTKMTLGGEVPTMLPGL